jgi:hypothetical protein
MLGRVVIALTLLFMLPILLIRAQPYNASLLRSALLPEDCAPPCFMGLRPGDTTLSEAIHFFEQRPNVHFAVQRSVVYNVSDDTAVLYWREDGSPISGSINFEKGQLMELMVQGLELHEIWLALGEPDSGQMAMEMIYTDGANVFSRPTAHINYYHNQQIRVHTPSTCLAFWQQLSYVVIGQSVAPDSVSGGPTMAQQRQAACEQERAYLRIIREG